MCVCMYICIYVCVYDMYVCIHSSYYILHTYTHIHTHTGTCLHVQDPAFAIQMPSFSDSQGTFLCGRISSCCWMRRESNARLFRENDSATDLVRTEGSVVMKLFGDSDCAPVVRDGQGDKLMDAGLHGMYAQDKLDKRRSRCTFTDSVLPQDALLI